MTALIGAVATLIGAIAGRILMPPTPSANARPPMEERQPTDPPLGKPDPKPTTDDGVIAARILQERANVQLAQLLDRVAVSEMRLCLLEQELRDTRLALVAVEAGKRATLARDQFRTSTAGWGACFLDVKDVQRRGALRDAAANALGR